METKDYRALFEQSSALVLVIDTGFTIVAASDEFLKVTKTIRENIMGRDIFDVFPDNPHDITANGESKIRASFNRVLATKVSDTLPVTKYDIPKPESPDGEFEVKYWKPVHSPVFDEFNNVKYIIQQLEDVIENELLTEQLAFEKKALKQVEDSEKRYNMMLMQSPFAFAVMKGKDMVITLANDSIKELWGKGKCIEGKPLWEVLPEVKDSPFPALLDQVYTTGIAFNGDELLAPLIRNGKLEDPYFNFVYQPYLEADETISGVTIIAYEVTDRVLVNKRIEESEAHFRQLADLMPAKITNADADGNVIYFNKHWLDYTGLNFEELRDFGYYKIMHPDELDEFQKRLRKAGETGTVLEMEMRFMNKEGQYRWHLNLASPVKDENGHTKMWVGSTTDIHEQKTAAEKIKASEARFRLLVQQAPVAICVVRGDDYIVEIVNEGMAQFWGRTMEQVLNKPIFDVLTELGDQGFKQLVDNVYHTGERFVAQELPINLIRNGKLENAFVKFIYEPLRDSDGTVTGVMCLAHEITEQVIARKKIEVSEKKFHLLTDAMPQKITNADAAGNVIFFNQQWLDDTGLTVDELKDGGWAKLMHPDDLELLIKNWKHSVATGDVFDMECRIQNKEGEYRWHLSRAVPIRDENGKIFTWVGSNTDIHEQKEQKEALEKAVRERTKELERTNRELSFQIAEKEKGEVSLKNNNLELTAAHHSLEKFNSELEETIKERTGELGKSNKDLRRINADLDNFIYTASHDLKAPINNIEGLVKHLVKKIPNDNIEYLKVIEMINHSIGRFKNTLLDLSEIAKIQPGDETDSVVLNFKEIASFVKEDISSLIKEAEATLIEDYSKAAEVKFSRKNLRSVLYNLISNAVKYRSAERKAVVEITTDINKEDFIVLSVKDNGLGIKEEDKEKVFAMFQRLHAHVEGTGVGMSIVKRIIDNAEGKIEVESKLNEGTTFRIYFKRK